MIYDHAQTKGPSSFLTIDFGIRKSAVFSASIVKRNGAVRVNLVIPSPQIIIGGQKGVMRLPKLGMEHLV